MCEQAPLHANCTLNNITVTGKVHPQINVLPSFTHHHVDLYLYAVILFCGTHKYGLLL